MEEIDSAECVKDLKLKPKKTILYRKCIKRLIDFSSALMGVIVLSPILLVIAVAIKLDSKGPVFFIQERLGKNGRIFSIIKFRTMIVNAEHIGKGLFITRGKDDRITKVGKFLRATSLDELPQLFNVIIGNMSLVGPRPPVVYHPYNGYQNYPESAKKRFAMQPGITGLTQVTVRESVSWDERIAIDIKYVENFTLGLDLKILFKTIKKAFNSESIYGPDCKEAVSLESKLSK